MNFFIKKIFNLSNLFTYYYIRKYKNCLPIPKREIWNYIIIHIYLFFGTWEKKKKQKEKSKEKLRSNKGYSTSTSKAKDKHGNGWCTITRDS